MTNIFIEGLKLKFYKVGEVMECKFQNCKTFANMTDQSLKS